MLCNTLARYIQHVPDLCVYQLGADKISSRLVFPKVHTLTLIQCSRVGVSRILHPTIFPNLQRVHYLSAHPGGSEIHLRFPKSVKWLFPNLQFPFYECMIEGGYGRVENRLIQHYIQYVSKRDNGIQVDLNLPGYGLCNGSWYHYQIRDFFATPRYSKDTIPSEYSYIYGPNPDPFDYAHPYFDSGNPETSVQAYLQKRMEQDFMEQILKECMEEEK
jgi:hypothetical protein